MFERIVALLILIAGIAAAAVFMGDHPGAPASPSSTTSDAAGAASGPATSAGGAPLVAPLPTAPSQTGPSPTLDLQAAGLHVALGGATAGPASKHKAKGHG